ncbi:MULTISPECIES: hypothetical protein [Sediminispirochaeta]|jgi:hypothetical protein|uniref:Uncharacterized protein n=1 Tax=Sediminispirochaeta smaragdinae (strain DSM 11293 / JCM 15392 / SEBR 4228) TaxID=573413 RepID=E1R9E9_SEDSS|nr:MULTISPECIES: hypothetical protein [Sediminispirochaeta]ADK83118.1 hypothetical protein Spirs_4035 [Sediminispirochaeta smaragdinae DSM 11293]
MIFWILVGVVLGYFFKPQLDRVVGRIVRSLRDNHRDDRGRWE